MPRLSPKIASHCEGLHRFILGAILNRGAWRRNLLFPDGGGVEPGGGGVVGEELQQVFEEAPHRVVLHQVMCQDAGRFVDITITGAPGLQVLNQNRDGGINTDKTALVTPVYRIEMRVYLE